MRAALCRRLAVLEFKLNPAKAISNLDREIKAMSISERSALRDFLILLKNGGKTGDAEYDDLKIAAEKSMLGVRQRLGIL